METTFGTLGTQIVLERFDASFKVRAIRVQMIGLSRWGCVDSVWYASLDCHRCEVSFPPAPHDKTEMNNSPKGEKQQTCDVPADLIPELSPGKLKARNHTRRTNGKRCKLHLGKLS